MQVPVALPVGQDSLAGPAPSSLRRRRGAELSRQPWRPALLDFYESIGILLDALAVPEEARFDAAGTLVNYVLGVAV
ncbi:hypothetical protein ACFYPX_21545 [Micromonospora zamorensis]|uniref:hypothetical protein n=1 Tax=Micromonospora zamorensis TaxID=709883 RepID=UPI003686ABE6